MQIKFRMDEDGLKVCWRPEKIRVLYFPYGCAISDHSEEWAVGIVYVGRQSGLGDWAVQLIQVDGCIRTKSGTCLNDLIPKEIELAIGELTREANWLEPIN